MKIPFSVYDFFAFLSTGFIVLAAVDYSFELGWMIQDKLPPGVLMFLIVVSYVIGHIVAHLSSYFLEHRFLRGVLISPEEHLFQDQKTGFWTWVFPIFYKPFPPETQKRVLDRARTVGFEKPGRGLFFHCFAIVKRDKSTADRLATFLNVYGFCRNACMASLIAAAIMLFASLWRLNWSTRGGFEADKFGWSVVAMFVALGLFYRYLKFFKHYTEEVFRDYAEPSLHPEEGVEVYNISSSKNGGGATHRSAPSSSDSCSNQSVPALAKDEKGHDADN